MFSLLNCRSGLAALAIGIAGLIAPAPGPLLDAPAAVRERYLAMTRGWARDAVLAPADTLAMERGRRRERAMTDGLDDPLAREILARGEPSFEALAAAYPGKILDRTVLGAYSDPRTAPDSGDEFVVWWNGAISAHLVRGALGADPARLQPIAENTNILFRVGAAAEMFGRVADRYSRLRYEDGYLPMVGATYRSDGIDYGETAVASDAGRPGSDVAYVRFDVTNTTRERRTAEVHVDVLLADGSRVTARDGQVLDASGALLLAFSGDAAFDDARQRLTHRVALSPGATASLLFAIPLVPDPTRTLVSPTVSGFERIHDVLRRAWSAVLASGMDIAVPEPRVNDIWRALVLQNFVLADGPRLTYGSGLVYNDSYYPFESGFAALVMARYGHADAAEAWLSYLFPASVDRDKAGWRYQNRRAIPLHLLYQFYLLTGRTQYFEEHRDGLFRVADEIVADRQATMGSDGDPRGWHRGLLPPARPAVDAIASTRETYVVAHDITNCQGLQDFGEFLVGSTIDPRRGESYLREAAAFRRDLTRAMTASMIRTPGNPAFVPLETLYFRDTPEYGPEPFHNLALGRVQGTYYHYWADMEFRYDYFDPADTIGQTIADFIGQRGGFVLGLTRARPRAGQPYGWINADYNAGYYEYALRRGRVEPFLLGFYSRLAFAASRQLYVASEGAPFIGYNTVDGGLVGAEYPFPNSAANAETLDMLRVMLVREDRERNVPTGVVDLAQATPRAWLENGKRIDVRRAPTEFGELSFSVESKVAQGLIAATVDPPRRRPFRALRLYLRHPSSLPIKSVRVNGAAYADFDAAAGYVSLRPGPAHFTIDASYR